MQAYVGGRATDTLIPTTLDAGEWSCLRHGHFISGREPRCPLKWRLARPHSRSGRTGEEKKSLSQTGIRTPDRPARTSVATPITLSRLT